MSHALYEYVRSLSGLQAWLDFRAGFARDLSGQANHGTIVATSSWKRGRRGHELYPGSAGGVSIADAAALRPDGAHTVVLFVRPFRSTGLVGGRFWSCSTTGVGNAPEVRVGAADQLNYYDTLGNDRTLAFTMADAEMVAITLSANAGTPKGYKNGVLVGNFSGTATLSANAAAHYVGNYPTGVAPLGTSVRSFIFCDQELSAATLGKLWELWQQAAHIDVRPTRRRTRISVPKEYAATARALRVQLGPPVGGVCPDLSGRGNVGTVTQPVNTAEGIFGRALEFHGRNSAAGAVGIVAGSDIDNLGAYTVALWARIDSSGGGTFGRPWTKGSGVWDIYVSASTATTVTFTLRVSYSDGVETWAFSAPIGPLIHIVAVHDKSDPANDPVVYLNAVSVSVTLTSARRSGSLTDDSAYALYFGSRGDGVNEHDGLIEDVRVYASELSAADVREIYLEGARRLRLATPRTAYPVSVAGVTAGQVGPYEVQSGTHTWADDGTTRGLVTSADGRVVTQQRAAYGSWYFRLKHADASSTIFVPIGTVAAAWNDAAQNGYLFQLHSDEKIYFYRLAAGVSAPTLFSTAAGYVAAGTEYEFLLTRTVAGVFTLYIKGGAFTDWTTVSAATGSNPVTDTTYTTSAWAVADLDAADELRDFRHYQGAMTAAEFEALGLSEAA